MTDKKILHQLAIERCRLHVSHICALNHMMDEDDVAKEVSQSYLNGLIANLNQDFEFIENLIVKES